MQLGALQVGADLPLLEAAAANRNRPFAVVLVAGGLLEAAERAATSASHASLAQGIMQRAFNVVQALQLEASLVRRAVATAATAAAAAEAAAEAGMARAVAEAADSIRQALCEGGAVDEQGMLRTAAAWLPPARQLATALLAWWRRPEERQAAALELAQAAATRSCAYLRCANLGGEGGPAAGQGAGSMRCRCARGKGELNACEKLCLRWNGSSNRVSPLIPRISHLALHAAPAVLCGTAAPTAHMPTGGRGTAVCARRWARRGRRRRSGGGRRQPRRLPARSSKSEMRWIAWEALLGRA